MPWFGNTAPVASPTLGATILDTGILPTGPTQGSLFNVALYVWTNSATAIDVSLNLISASGAILTSQVIPVSFWAFLEFRNMLPASQQRFKVLAASPVNGSVSVSIALELVK